LYVQIEWPDLKFPLSSHLESFKAAYLEHESSTESSCARGGLVRRPRD